MNPLCRRNILLTLALILMSAVALYAQDDVDDYRQYKFYKEEDNATNELWLTAVERSSHDEDMAIDGNMTNVVYTLSVAGFERRGEGYHERKYKVGELDVDYSTARMLGALGLRYDDYLDAQGSVRRYFGSRETQYYAGHYLRAEFSGSNYLGGISHRARYRPAKRGVVLNDGWSIGHYARLRTGRDLYVDGVYTNALDVAAIATYRDRRNWLNIAVILPMSERGLRSASVDEAYTLTGNPRYNPSWGMQDGKMRNSRVATSLHPDVVASWQRRITATTTMSLSANMGFECRGYSTLAWFNANNPMPDNYRYLPSYYADDDTSREVYNAWLRGDERYTQIDWQGLYHTNALQTDGCARYAVERRRENMLRTAINLAFSSRIGGVDVDYGVVVDYRTSHEFKVMDDLLGADHLVDIDYYLIDDATYSNNLQNDLRNPNRTIGEGDRYGYDYRLSRLGAALYGAVQYSWGDMHLAAELNVGGDNTLRRGYYEKELFPGNGSYGRSRNLTTNPYRLNLSWDYNLEAHMFTASASVRGVSPDTDDMFLQTQYNNRPTEGYRLATVVAADMSYQYTRPNLKIGATLFCRSTADESDVVHYYDDLARIYSDAVISDICRLNLGVEVVATVRWLRYFTSTAMITAAMHRYRRDANVRLYADTDNDLVAVSRAAMRGLRVGTPELSAYGDVTFRHSGWTARLALSYVGGRYVEPSIVRRAERVLSFAPSPEEREALISMERLADVAMLDASLSKRIRLNEGLTLNIQLSARNLLGTNFVRNGYEQSRVRRTTVAGRTHISPFVNRLNYAYPRTFYLSASLWF